MLGPQHASGAPPVVTVEIADDAGNELPGPPEDVVRAISTGAGGAAAAQAGWHATVTTPWAGPASAAGGDAAWEAACDGGSASPTALPVPQVAGANDGAECSIAGNPDKDDAAKIRGAALGAQLHLRHNSWFGEIQSPWLTEIDIDVEDADVASNGGGGGGRGVTGAAKQQTAACVLAVPTRDSIVAVPDTPRKTAAPESPWVQKWHVHVDNVERDDGDYTVGLRHESPMDISHLHPVNDMHIETVDLQHMHQIHEHTLGGHRRKKHPSWHQEVRSQWMDEFRLSGEGEDSDTPVAVRHHADRTLGGASAVKKHASWHGEVETQWMAEYGICAGDVAAAVAPVPHPVNDHPEFDPVKGHPARDSLGALRKQRHASWAGAVASPWLEAPHSHPVNDHACDESAGVDTVLEGAANGAGRTVPTATLGGQRARKHDSWRAKVTSPWLDDNNTAGCEDATQDFDIVSVSPHLRNLQLR